MILVKAEQRFKYCTKSPFFYKRMHPHVDSNQENFLVPQKFSQLKTQYILLSETKISQETISMTLFLKVA